MRHYNKTRGKPKRKIRHITRKIRKGKKTRKFLIKKKGLRKIIRKLTKKILQRGGRALTKREARLIGEFLETAQKNQGMVTEEGGKLKFTKEAEDILERIHVTDGAKLCQDSIMLVEACGRLLLSTAV